MNRKRPLKAKKLGIPKRRARTKVQPPSETTEKRRPVASDNTASTEGCLQEENQPKILTLKNGTQIDMRLGLALLDVLRNLSEDQPHHFQVLLAMAQGHEVDDPESIKFLRRCGHLRKDRTINPNDQNILISAYQNTPEGFVLINPFILTDAAEARALELYVQQRYLRFLRILREEKDEGQSP
jgi:hypothetical protein